MTRKKALSPAPKSCRDVPRELAPARAPGRAYPTLAELRSSMPAMLTRAAQAAMWASAIGSSLSGCATPTCQTSSFDEAKVHGGNALGALLTLSPGDAMDEFNVALGISPHASVVAGGMMPMMPPPVVLDAGTATTLDAGPIVPIADIPLGGAIAPVLPAPVPDPAAPQDDARRPGGTAVDPAADPPTRPLHPEANLRMGGAPPRVDPAEGL